jgi:2'-5' RNA ligase
MTSASRPLRLFVAVLLPEAWLSALARAQDELRNAGLRLRYVRPEGIHLTLKFLGEVDHERLEVIMAALDGLGDVQPFALDLDTLGVFGGPQRPRIVWAGLRGDLTALAALVAAVDAALVPAGFAPEGRPFRPHLTLARVPEGLPDAEARRIVPVVSTSRLVRVPSFHVDSYALVRSALGPGGARYTTLQTWPVARPASR